MTEKTTPTREEIDALAGMYVEAQAAVDKEQQAASVLRDQLIDMIQEHGFLPPRASKSKRIQGDEWKVTLSQGQSVEVDGTIAREIRKALKLIGRVRYFRKLFRPEIVYVLANGSQKALACLAEVGIPAPDHRDIISLYNRAVAIKDKSPSLEVEPMKKKAKESKAA